jgi:hypothetical protein
VRAPAGRQLTVADDLGQLLVRLAVTAKQLDHRLGHLGQLGGELGQVGHGDPRRQRLAQIVYQPWGVVRREECGVDAEQLGDANEHRDGQRPGVVLNLVEIAG